MLIDVWPVTIITRVEAFFAFLGGKGAKKIYFTYIFVIREPQSMTYQKFLHSDRVPLKAGGYSLTHILYAILEDIL